MTFLSSVDIGSRLQLTGISSQLPTVIIRLRQPYFFQGLKHKSSIYLFLNKFNKFTETTSSYTEKTAPPIIIHSARNWNLEQFPNI